MTRTAMRTGPFKATWKSLQRYRCPAWFRDAKFGIWAHWGPQSAPMRGDWYARNMYLEGSEQYKYHCKRFGHPSRFGYKDIIPLWKAERFRPGELIALYKKAGARYFVSMAVHHDNFDLWNSRHHRWNAVNMGPKRDIVGAWRAAALAQGLRFGITQHLERTYCWFNTNKGADTHGPYAGVPYDGNMKEYEDLYIPRHDDTSPAFPRNPSRAWVDQWFARLMDLFEHYEPDMIYTDGSVPFGRRGREMIASYYNLNMARHEGRLEGVYAVKDMRRHDRAGGLYHGEFRPGIGVLDIERGGAGKILPDPWQTDTSLGDWFYHVNDVYKTSGHVIAMLVDAISKNGNLLMNFPQHPDGTLDAHSLGVLDDLAAWFAINAEAVHATRPWTVFGEGETMSPGGDFNEGEITYHHTDVRFTARGKTVYAFLMKPGRDILVRSLAGRRVASVELLGGPAVRWQALDVGLYVRLPRTLPGPCIPALKIVPR